MAATTGRKSRALPACHSEHSGRSGSVSGADSQRVYAIVEADDGGVFRSEDAGAHWSKVSEDRKVRQRAFYYSRIYADPKNANTVYVMNTAFFKSTDGERSSNRSACRMATITICGSRRTTRCAW